MAFTSQPSTVRQSLQLLSFNFCQELSCMSCLGVSHPRALRWFLTLLSCKETGR